MKPINALKTATAGLANYLQSEGNAATWTGFRDHRAGESYRELMERLVALQHDLCCYCEITFRGSDRQIEHVVPRSASGVGSAKALKPSNLAACCKGGSARSFATNGLADEDRYVKPVARNLSCGQSKADTTDLDFLDPRVLPKSAPLFRVRRDGNLGPNREACRSAGIPVARVERTIEILGLNVRRLRRARRRAWRKLGEDWADQLGDPDLAAAAARQLLLPDASGCLAAFFTTNRTWFGPVGERVLAEPPRRWV